MMAPAAHAATGNSDFSDGVSAFQAGHYDKALQAFNRAQKSGLDTSALWYNFGVSYYRLQRFTEAAAAFEKLINHKGMRQIAYYNLGLVAAMQDDVKAAEKWFSLSQQGGDGKISELSSTALRRLQTANTGRPEKPWQGYVKLRFARDDNVTRAHEDIDNTNRLIDSFTEVTATALYPLPGTRRDEFVLGGSGNVQEYNHETAYNFTLGRVFGHWDFPVTQWRTRIFLDTAKSRFGNESYLATLSGGIQSQYHAHGPLGRIRLRYRWSQIRSDNSKYDFLRGNTQQLLLLSRIYVDSARLQWDYTHEIQNRKDLALGDKINTPQDYRFYSYSPTRQQLRLFAKLPFNRAWTAELDLRYRISRYANAHQFNDSYRKLRRDARSTIELEVKRNFSRQWDVGISYQTLRNDSNINYNDGHKTTNYDYTRTVISLSSSYSFN